MDNNRNNLNNNIKIDERINKVCENAEIEYTQRHKKNNEIKKDNNGHIIENGNGSINNSNYYINNNKNNYLNNQKLLSPINNNNNDNNDNSDQNLFLSQSYSNIARINNKSLDKDVNILSKFKLNLQNNKIQKPSTNNYNNINSPFHKLSDNYNKKIALYNLDEKKIDKNKNKQNKNNININKQNKIKSDLSKILLESRDLIKKLKIKQAYILLKNTILTNVQHSDLFYLYGEVNRLIKQYKTAEDYLLKSLKFELHSPYAFYSLGLLYQELKEYQNSIKFFKLFNRLMDNADLHFQIGLNYFYIKDYVNAAEELSKAIELNGECAEFYQFRSEIYKKMGLKEMEDEDFRMYWYIIQKKKEEE